jgi:ABC-type transporter Mla MlaB component
MSGGDPEGPSTRPGAGWWSGIWQRFAHPGAQGLRPQATGPGDGLGYSRESLQLMIDRKRHNEALRQREFGMLRKLLGQNAGAGAMQPPAFHSSIPHSRDERATTLRKIDEIEAQMSSQWRPVKARQTTRRPAAVRLPLAGAGAGEDFVHDPAFEEAALRFASGDTAGAEAALRAMLEPDHPRAGDVQTWLFLFDLYWASGQPQHHDDLGADFARRFQRSPPQWRGPDDLLPPQAFGASRVFPLSVVNEPAFDWTCPAVLDAAGVASLQAALSRQPQPWSLSWGAVSRLEPDAVAPLAQLVAHWARQPVRLRLAGVEALERILDARTACGDRGVDPAWWALRLDWLRATRRPQEFELVALDYCVTYEVSPPSWAPPLCELRLLGSGGAGGPRQPVQALEPRVSVLGVGGMADPSEFAASTLATPCAGELAGTLLGDTVAACLARLDARPQGAELQVVACDRLLRLDFEGAGALANWVAARQREGRAVHLAGVHRLVAALLGALGLAAQARITLRRD